MIAPGSFKSVRDENSLTRVFLVPEVSLVQMSLA
jgi:hypothetical protein